MLYIQFRKHDTMWASILSTDFVMLCVLPCRLYIVRTILIVLFVPTCRMSERSERYLSTCTYILYCTLRIVPQTLAVIFTGKLSDLDFILLKGAVSRDVLLQVFMNHFARGLDYTIKVIANFSKIHIYIRSSGCSITVNKHR